MPTPKTDPSPEAKGYYPTEGLPWDTLIRIEGVEGATKEEALVAALTDMLRRAEASELHSIWIRAVDNQNNRLHVEIPEDEPDG